MGNRLFLSYSDDSEKHLGFNTTVKLVVCVHGSLNVVLSYVRTDETIKECKRHKQHYIDLMLAEINEEIEK